MKTFTTAALLVLVAAGASAQQARGVNAPARPAEAPMPADYRIGPDDLLSIVFWREAEMSGDAVVRPDGKISLPLLNDIQASGLTPAELKAFIEQQAKKYLDAPSVSVVVKQINSRKAFITGSVLHSGPYPLGDHTTVLQLIAMAGGLTEYADSKNIVITRSEGGRSLAFKFNYKDIKAGKNLQSNIVLKPGDTVIVP